jgi:hypothetical protein
MLIFLKILGIWIALSLVSGLAIAPARRLRQANFDRQDGGRQHQNGSPTLLPDGHPSSANSGEQHLGDRCSSPCGRGSRFRDPGILGSGEARARYRAQYRRDRFG